MNLRVQSTAWPQGGYRIYHDGMPKPDVKCFGQIMKMAVQNEIRKNGIANEQLTLVEQARELLSQTTKRLNKVYGK